MYMYIYICIYTDIVHLYTAFPPPGIQFTCFTSTKSQKLTPVELSAGTSRAAAAGLVVAALLVQTHKNRQLY
jgi:hypothetical protein